MSGGKFFPGFSESPFFSVQGKYKFHRLRGYEKVLNNFGWFGMRSQTPPEIGDFSGSFFAPSGNMG
jgi:hypothetical protein